MRTITPLGTAPPASRRACLAPLARGAVALCWSEPGRSPARDSALGRSGRQVKATAAQRRRLKALHWDKIRAPPAGTVWSQAAGRQLKLDFDHLESLFQARDCPVL
jgi:hypothetical protein